MTGWSKGIVKLQDTPTRLVLSVVFTWDIPAARAICLQETQREVIVGGPAVRLLPEYLADCATIVGEWPGVLQAHNPQATRSTVGCNRGCSFCGVKVIEGAFRELPDFTPAPVLCDSNFLQSSRKHFDRVIDRLKDQVGVDFNQGLDARKLKAYHAGRLRELDMSHIRLAWDSAGCETPVMDAIALLRGDGFPKSKISVYCIVNAGEEPAEALYRLETLKASGYRGFPMRYQPLDSLVKDSHVDPRWDEAELKRFMWYWSRQAWLSGVKYEECHWTVKAQSGQLRMAL
jgi:hypothetical protein